MAHTSTMQISQTGLDRFHSHDLRGGDPCRSRLMSTEEASAEPCTETAPGSPGTGFYFCSEQEPGCEEDREAVFLQCAIPKHVQTSTHQAVRPGCSSSSAQDRALGPLPPHPRGTGRHPQQPREERLGKGCKQDMQGCREQSAVLLLLEVPVSTSPRSALSQHMWLWQSFRPNLHLPACPRHPARTASAPSSALPPQPLPGGSC